jgi:hypothetical protein
MRSRLVSLVVMLALAVLASARAADFRLAGSKLLLRKNPASERLVLVAREGVIAPLPGSTEDPLLVGGELVISNPNTGERARFPTSARDWTVNALGTVFRFDNHLESGPGSEVRTIQIKNRGRLKIGARALGITLDEEAQQALSVVVRTGTRRYCFLFGGRIGKDRPGRFVAHKAPAPDACPPVLAGPSTTTTTRPPGPRPTTTSTRPSTPTTSSTTSTVQPPTSTSTSTTSSTTKPTLATTTSTRPPTTSTTRIPTTTTTTTTEPSCSFRGNSCKGKCPAGRRCESLFGRFCACLLD